MSLGEFDLIARYFTRPSTSTGPGNGKMTQVDLGIGDDCALLSPSPGMQMAISSDMLVEGRHFLSTVPPERLGHKALAVNLSDLAACGARPRAYTLALSLPRVDEQWLAAFAQGLHALADAHGITLVGGDTTAGPLNLCITVFGEVPVGEALLRSGARVGDELWVSHARRGALGDARLALEVFRGRVQLPGEAFARIRLAMERPRPRVALGQSLRGVASSAIDISDGLMGDLGHVLKRSGNLGAVIQADRLPCSEALALLPAVQRLQYQLSGGDDYELLFTAPTVHKPQVLAASQVSDTAVRCIGRIVAEPGLRVLDERGQSLATPWASFDHFRA